MTPRASWYFRWIKYHSPFKYVLSSLAIADIRLFSDPIIAKLDVEYNELLPTWRKFQEYLSPEDRIDFQERPQTVEDVLRVVCDAADHWTSSERRHAFWCSTAIFSRVAASMESHSIILSVLPDKEVYSSLLYAVLLSVIKVRPYHITCV